MQLRHSKQIFATLFTLFCISILVFGFYRLTPIMQKPSIEIYTPKNGDISSKDLIEIKGRGKNLQELYMNGSKVNFSKDGYFETKLPVFPQNNILKIVGLDKFNRKIVYTLNVYGDVY